MEHNSFLFMAKMAFALFNLLSQGVVKDRAEVLERFHERDRPTVRPSARTSGLNSGTLRLLAAITISAFVFEPQPGDPACCSA